MYATGGVIGVSKTEMIDEGCLDVLEQAARDCEPHGDWFAPYDVQQALERHDLSLTAYEDAYFISICDPQTMLSLIAEIRETRKRAART